MYRKIVVKKVSAMKEGGGGYRDLMCLREGKEWLLVASRVAQIRVNIRETV